MNLQKKTTTWISKNQKALFRRNRYREGNFFYYENNFWEKPLQREKKSDYFISFNITALFERNRYRERNFFVIRAIFGRNRYKEEKI
jgi:hypothetical protein